MTGPLGNSKFCFQRISMFNPLSPNIHIQILQTGLKLYISLRNKLRGFGIRSKHFLLGDHFINSHNPFSW